MKSAHDHRIESVDMLKCGSRKDEFSVWSRSASTSRYVSFNCKLPIRLIKSAFRLRIVMCLSSGENWKFTKERCNSHESKFPIFPRVEHNSRSTCSRGVRKRQRIDNFSFIHAAHMKAFLVSVTFLFLLSPVVID